MNNYEPFLLVYFVSFNLVPSTTKESFKGNRMQRNDVWRGILKILSAAMWRDLNEKEDINTVRTENKLPNHVHFEHYKCIKGVSGTMISWLSTMFVVFFFHYFLIFFPFQSLGVFLFFFLTEWKPHHKKSCCDQWQPQERRSSGENGKCASLHFTCSDNRLLHCSISVEVRENIEAKVNCLLLWSGQLHLRKSKALTLCHNRYVINSWKQARSIRLQFVNITMKFIRLKDRFRTKC